MKKVLLVLLGFIIILSGTAFAEDGFKAYVGYFAGYHDGQHSTNDYSFRDRYNGKIDGFLHGPSVDIRYEGAFLVRGTFDYLMGESQKVTYHGTNYSANVKYHSLAGEGDLGYRVYHGGNVSIYPYVGIGYMENKYTRDSASANWAWSKFSAPYAAVGGLVKYDASRWSIGLDAAGLVAFAGEYSRSNRSIDAELSYGFKIQTPVTYTISKNKPSGVDIMLFATPYFHYLDSQKADIEHVEKYRCQFRDYTVGIKAGIGFAF
jgi:hypothetical protein